MQILTEDKWKLEVIAAFYVTDITYPILIEINLTCTVICKEILTYIKTWQPEKGIWYATV